METRALINGQIMILTDPDVVKAFRDDTNRRPGFYIEFSTDLGIGDRDLSRPDSTMVWRDAGNGFRIWTGRYRSTHR